jgi:hypothetical protein
LGFEIWGAESGVTVTLPKVKNYLQNYIPKPIVLMLLTLENTKDLNPTELVEFFSIELFEDENLYLLNEPKRDDVLAFFYHLAYILEFDTTLQMSGLETILTNSTAYNFENTLDSFRAIGSIKFTNCLEGILKTLAKYGLTPIKMRERFEQGITDLPEYSVITVGQFLPEEALRNELHAYQDVLYEDCNAIRNALGAYVASLRGE